VQLQEIETGPGYTATLAAVGRAVHSQGDWPLIKDDLALGLAGEAGTALLAQLTAQLPEASCKSFGFAFAIRARFVEDAVELAIRDGLDQYAILGAGLDSFPYRRPDGSGRLAIFEVDRPASQAWKRRRLGEMGVAVPDSLTYVPLDITARDLRQTLVAAGFDLAKPAIVSAIALTQYLAQPAIEDMLRLVASLAPGSRLVITYVVPESELSDLAAAGLKWTMSQAEDRGEPFLSLFRPAEFEQLAHRSGFSRVEEVGSTELIQRYLADRPDAQLTGIERIATAYV
jgi:methyltransferase (TIGR00027 family)